MGVTGVDPNAGRLLVGRDQELDRLLGMVEQIATLRASGERARRRVPAAWTELSPQELQIAQLAAEGLSNRDIGEQLYLSHRTVSTHLHRLFPKLGITSRTQLRDALQPPRSS